MNELPIVCTLPPGELKRRGEDLLPGLLARAASREPLTEGLRLRFTPSVDILETITRTIDAERQCCQFFRFQLTVEPGLGPIVLDVSGPPGTGRFLAGLIDPETTRPQPTSSEI